MNVQNFNLEDAKVKKGTDVRVEENLAASAMKNRLTSRVVFK